LILGWLAPDATAAGMATTPTGSPVWPLHTGKDRTDRHALLPRSGVFSFLWSGFRTKESDHVARSRSKSPDSLRLEPFPAEWKVVSPVRSGMSDGWSEFRTHWKSGSEVILHPGLHETNCLVSSIALVGVVLGHVFGHGENAHLSVELDFVRGVGCDFDLS
jgi:hypothetical protein